MLLGKIDSKDKLRFVRLEHMTYDITNSASLNEYGYVSRKLWVGWRSDKFSYAPDIVVKPKNNKTLLECIDNETKKLVTKYKDSGYVAIPDNAWDHTDDTYEQSESIKDYIRKVLPVYIKPMGCYDGNDHPVEKYKKYLESDEDVFLMATPKIDGIRATCQVVNGEVEFRTKTGKLIKSMDHLKNNTFLKSLKHPVDGELYIHGKSLQYIKGLATRQYSNKDTEELEYYIFDAIMDLPAYVRRCLLVDEFDDYCNTYEAIPEHKITLVESRIVTDYKKIKVMEEDFIAQGYEGVVIRKSTGMYNYGKKTPDMVKYKPYQDDEFTVLGTADGRRPEDYTVTCRTKDGEMFEAKPMGTVEERLALYDEIMKVTDHPKKGTVKYFTLSEAGIPTQPQFKCLRNDGD
jgi:hypothetical protein